ncbi:MAG: hypothetical protein ACKPKO_52905, partial [Candidatus Fonsibacter sp.]
GTLMRDHNKYHQALLLVGVFNLKTLLFDNVFDIDKKRLSWRGSRKKRYLSSDYQMLKMSKKTTINSSSFTHVSNKVMLYSNIYEPDERVAEYQSYKRSNDKSG